MIDKLISELGELKLEIQNDTTRKKIIDYTDKLWELVLVFAEAKKETVRLKGIYERESIKRKEQCKQYLAKEAQDKFDQDVLEAEEKHKSKVKKEKVSNVDADDLCKLEMLGFMDWDKFLVHSLDDAQQTVVYLDPIIKIYTEFTNSVKFVDNLNKSLTI